MHTENLHRWKHSHTFGQDEKRKGESRTLIVIVLTTTMMVVEIVAGILFGSMALLADGLHMASHAAALGISLFAYIYARRNAHDPSFSFGTGKINALAGFSSALLLAGFAVMMAWHSIERLVTPVPIGFNQAILVAILGLIINGVSVWILGEDHSHDQSNHEPGQHTHHHHEDHNLRAAYFHVLADALTSILAIGALLTAKYIGWIWMDPLMGIIGAGLITHWSIGLVRSTSSVLLDRQGPESIREKIRWGIEGNSEDRVTDLHVWSIGPGIYSVVLSVVSHAPKPPDIYKAKIPDGLGLVHIVVEVLECCGEDARLGLKE